MCDLQCGVCVSGACSMRDAWEAVRLTSERVKSLQSDRHS